MKGKQPEKFTLEVWDELVRSMLEPVGGRSPEPDEMRTASSRAVRVVMGAWGQALQEEMDYPISRSGSGLVGFAYGHLNDYETLDDVEGLPGLSGRDYVYLDFAASVLAGPSEIMFVTRDDPGVRLFRHCEVWALAPRFDIELVAASHRIQKDGTRRVRLKPNNLDNMRARRVAIAHARWTARAVEIAGDPERVAREQRPIRSLVPPCRPMELPVSAPA